MDALCGCSSLVLNDGGIRGLSMRQIAIIGGGCSAVLTVVQILKQRTQPVRIDVYEPSENIGRGVAYSTPSELHRLNVPAARMGAFPDVHDDFHRWVQDKGISITPGGFAPRPLYGAYLTELFESTVLRHASTSTVTHIREVVLQIKKDPHDEERWSVVTSSGGRTGYDAVVLAIGLPDGGWPKSISGLEESSTGYPEVFIEDVWGYPLESFKEGAHVGVLGTGLSAIDVSMSVLTSASNTKVTLMSRHGLVPAPHFTEPTEAVPLEKANFIGTLREIVATFTSLLKEYRWDAVIDSIRPHIPRIWSGFTQRERDVFIRHFRHRWDISRHRMAPEIAERIRAWQAEGRLEIIGGTCTSVVVSPDSRKIQVEIHTKSGTTKTEVDTLCNCTGFRALSDSDYNGLLSNLVRNGYVALDASKTGVMPSPALSLVLQPGLFVLGALLRAVRWESIAVPELRQQAAEVAGILLADSRFRSN